MCTEQVVLVVSDCWQKGGKRYPINWVNKDRSTLPACPPWGISKFERRWKSEERAKQKRRQGQGSHVSHSHWLIAPGSGHVALDHRPAAHMVGIWFDLIKWYVAFRTWTPRPHIFFQLPKYCSVPSLNLRLSLDYAGKRSERKAAGFNFECEINGVMTPVIHEFLPDI